MLANLLAKASFFSTQVRIQLPTGLHQADWQNQVFRALVMPIFAGISVAAWFYMRRQAKQKKLGRSGREELIHSNVVRGRSTTMTYMILYILLCCFNMSKEMAPNQALRGLRPP